MASRDDKAYTLKCLSLRVLSNGIDYSGIIGMIFPLQLGVRLRHGTI